MSKWKQNFDNGQSSIINVLCDKQEKIKFSCACGRQYGSQYLVNYHQKWECGRQLKCSICSRIYNSKSNLFRHTRICQKRSYR